MRDEREKGRKDGVEKRLRRCEESDMKKGAEKTKLKE